MTYNKMSVKYKMVRDLVSASIVVAIAISLCILLKRFFVFCFLQTVQEKK